ncbi:MAG: DUF1648 domain-containing protein [Saprospiraceae bacterium]
MTRPRLVIPLTNNDKVLEIFALLGIIAIWAICIYNYSSLPETIPRHFNAAGEPDAFGNRNSIWILPIVTTGLYIGLTWVAKIPHAFNYPIKITSENAALQYEKAVQMIRILKVIITIGLSYMTYESVRVALGESQKMGSFTLILFLFAIFGLIGWYLFQIKKK